jgi:aspartate carbamoyltransferase regulatory subunit
MKIKERKVPAIKDGTVIDHIPSRETFRIMRIMDPQEFEHPISVTLNLYSKKMGKKGVIKIDNRFLTKSEVDKIAILAPNATVSIIRDYKIQKKIQVKLPKELIGIIKCSNPVCVTNRETVCTTFKVIRENPLEVKCHYCEKVYTKDEIELKKK